MQVRLFGRKALLAAAVDVFNAHDGVIHRKVSLSPHSIAARETHPCSRQAAATRRLMKSAVMFVVVRGGFISHSIMEAPLPHSASQTFRK